MTAQVQEIVTRQDVDRVYQDMVIAADLVEIAIEERMPRRVIEKRTEDMYRAVRNWERVSEMLLEQAEMAVA